MNCQSLFFNTLVERIGMAPVDFQRDQTAVPAASIATASTTADGGSLESRIRRVPGLPVRSARNSNAWLGGILAVLILVAAFFVNITWAEAKAASDSTLQQGEPTGHRSPPPPTVTAKKAEAVPVSGRVLYHDGTPAARVSVFLVGNAGTTIGDGKAWQGIRSDNMEDKTVTKTSTDAAGRFTLPGGGDAKRIVVSAPRLDFWVVPRPENAAVKDSEFTIKLPAPGRLVVKYDIPGGDAKAKLSLQVNTWDSPLSRGIQCTYGPLVANKGQVVLDNLPPGKCYLDREKNIAWTTLFCDRRLLTIESGKTLESNFIRDRGTAVVGQVVGLKKEMRAAVSGAADSAGVLVSVRSPEAKDGILSDFALPLFDVLKCGLDGRFRTEQLLPGKYAIVVEAWLPEKPEEMLGGGIRRSSFIGRAVVTVPESGQPLQVTVELKPRENTPPAKSGKDGIGSPSGLPKRLPQDACDPCQLAWPVNESY